LDTSDILDGSVTEEKHKYKNREEIFEVVSRYRMIISNRKKVKSYWKVICHVYTEVKGNKWIGVMDNTQAITSLFSLTARNL
jgi:hypothetical protein